MLKLEDIRCQYDQDSILENINLTLAHKDIGCLLGPSGCGKSTLLRAIAGFQPISNGLITLNNQTLSSPEHITSPEIRNIGMVFQDYALFPHLNVRENIAFGLHKFDKPKRTIKTKRMAELVGLEEHMEKYPHELSGGQQQRVALARALAPAPNLILLDEPFSNLDADLRRSLSLQVRTILKEMSISGILVTHDQQEAFAVCDYIGVIHEKKIAQWDTPYNLYHEPATRFVASFVGQGTFLPGIMISSDETECELGRIKGNRAYNWPPQTTVDVLLRPDDIVYSDNHEGKQVKIIGKQFTGATTIYQLQLNSGQSIEGILPSHKDFYVGQSIHIRLEAQDLITFPNSPN